MRLGLLGAIMRTRRVRAGGWTRFATPDLRRHPDGSTDTFLGYPSVSPLHHRTIAGRRRRARVPRTPPCARSPFCENTCVCPYKTIKSHKSAHHYNPREYVPINAVFPSSELTLYNYYTQTDSHSSCISLNFQTSQSR